MLTKPGDLLLFQVNERSTLIDKVIGVGQKIIGQAPSKRNYCHVGFVARDNGHYYEAAWPRAKLTLLNWHDLLKRNNIDIYRLKILSDIQLDQIFAYADAHIGELYDLGALFFDFFPSKHRVVCSTFAWQTYQSAGITLYPYETMDSPDDIAASPLLVRQ